jgi:hypothetical protein
VQPTAQEHRAGWRYRLFNGRHAIERFACRPCIQASNEMRHIWARKKQDCLEREREQSGQTGFYDHWITD